MVMLNLCNGYLWWCWVLKCVWRNERFLFFFRRWFVWEPKRVLVLYYIVWFLIVWEVQSISISDLSEVLYVELNLVCSLGLWCSHSLSIWRSMKMLDWRISELKKVGWIFEAMSSEKQHGSNTRTGDWKIYNDYLKNYSMWDENKDELRCWDVFLPSH